MREIAPYRTFTGAKNALDNGGRFYNLFAAAADNVVQPSELARAAGSISSDAKAFIFFEMALLDLTQTQRTETIALLNSDLRQKYEEQKPRLLTPSLVESEGIKGEPVIISGYPVFVENKSEFKGFILLVTPIITMIPIMDQYDVNELFDTPDLRTPKTVIATTRGSKRLDGVHARFGGLLHELQFEDKTGKSHGLFLDTLFYTPLT
jgi:hypothetical protein